jgi:hypothetical protein
MNHRLFASLLSLAVASTGIIVACSSDDTTPTPAPTNPTPGATTTVRVTAAAGGSVADPSGKTKLDIPPGALAADTDITLAILPRSGAAVVDISEFGPDGLTFLKPVTLTITADATLAPEGKALSVAVNEGADFKAITGSTFANGVATASIMHFSRYTVVLVDGKIVVNPPATCVDARSTFTACGGDPTGSWTFAEFCVDATVKTSGDGGAGNVCPENSVDIDYNLARDVTFDATTLKIGAGKTTLTAKYNYFLACFTRLPDGGMSGGATPTCAEIQKREYTDKSKAGSCADKTGGYCVCTETGETTAAEEIQTYTVSGTTLTTTKGDGSSSVSQFCVKGDLLYSLGAGKDGKLGDLFVLKRK